MSDDSFRPVAEREFQLSGPSERAVSVRIGAPEPDPGGHGDFRCPYQVIGLSDDNVHYAHGVDAFQALYLAFAGVRKFVKINASVLSAFHQDFALTWAETPWNLALPVLVAVHDADQLRRLERFLEVDLWSTEPGDE